MNSAVRRRVELAAVAVGAALAVLLVSEIWRPWLPVSTTDAWADGRYWLMTVVLVWSFLAVALLVWRRR